MTRATGRPAAVLLGGFGVSVLALLLTVPQSQPGGTGRQWDDLVSAGVAAVAAGLISARLRLMGPPHPAAQPGDALPGDGHPGRRRR